MLRVAQILGDERSRSRCRSSFLSAAGYRLTPSRQLALKFIIAGDTTQHFQDATFDSSCSRNVSSFGLDTRFVHDARPFADSSSLFLRVFSLRKNRAIKARVNVPRCREGLFVVAAISIRGQIKIANSSVVMLKKREKGRDLTSSREIPLAEMSGRD